MLFKSKMLLKGIESDKRMAAAAFNKVQRNAPLYFETAFVAVIFILTFD